MYRASLVLLVAMLALAQSASAAGVLINDDFTNVSAWNDMSTAITWDGYSTPVSAFTTASGKATLTSTAKSYNGYGPPNLMQFTALDKQFATPLDHTQNALVMTFSAKWDAGSLSNEGSRFGIFVNYDYPTGGLDMDLNDKYNDFDREWWARPAYNMRIRLVEPPSPGAKQSLLIYGASRSDTKTDKENAYYEAGDSNQDKVWDNWMPGFSAAPGAASPQVGVNGVADAGYGRYSQTQYKTYKYIITRSQQQLWFDADDNGTLDLVGVQDISGTYDSLGWRRNFPTLEGVRLYWRGSGPQALLDSFTAEVPLGGDANLDRGVDVGDLAILATNYGSTINFATEAGWQKGDFNGDGNIDVGDLAMLATAYGQSYTTGTPVPEPASMALVAIGAVGLLRRHR